MEWVTQLTLYLLMMAILQTLESLLAVTLSTVSPRPKPWPRPVSMLRDPGCESPTWLLQMQPGVSVWKHTIRTDTSDLLGWGREHSRVEKWKGHTMISSKTKINRNAGKDSIEGSDLIFKAEIGCVFHLHVKQKSWMVCITCFYGCGENQ